MTASAPANAATVSTVPLLAACVPLGSAPVISDSDAAELASSLKALAEPTRLKIVTYLLSQPGHEACTCDLAPMVGLTDATVSHHLKTLAAAGIVTKERRGMNVHYAVVPESIHAIARTLNAGCC